MNIDSLNQKKRIFTPGPAALLPSNIEYIKPCFGRNDTEYQETEEEVLRLVREISGHDQVARLQGSATLAIEIAIRSLIKGKIIVINTGYYSNRLYQICLDLLGSESVQYISLDSLWEYEKDVDWILACHVETSTGQLLNIHTLYDFCQDKCAFLFLDSTASIGLESGTNLADACAFSSCKGLFGLTGASFVCFNNYLNINVPESFSLSLNNHLEKRTTGPYHQIYSLVEPLRNYAIYRERVLLSKSAFLSLLDTKGIASRPHSEQPLLCTYVPCSIKSLDPSDILYKPRSSLSGSIVCHLGEIWKRSSIGSIYSSLIFEDQE